MVPFSFERLNTNLKRHVESTSEQSVRVFENKFLRLIATDSIQYVKSFSGNSPNYESLIKIEIGGAGGITKQIDNSWMVSDVRHSDHIDQIFSASAIPFRDSSVDIIYAQDVLHHIADLKSFSTEIFRVLKPGAVIVFREPYWGLVAQCVWRVFHPELFSLQKISLQQEFKTPMEGNQALAWALVRHKRPEIEEVFKQFRLLQGKPINGLAFFLSGGSTFTTKIPVSILTKIHNLEKKIPKWNLIFAFAYIFALQKPNRLHDNSK